MNSSRIPIVILGAGPAGLGAAFQLARRGCFEVIVLERSGRVGGNAGSFELAGVPVDYGSHRLHPSSKPEILADIRSMLGEELLDRPRHGRIRLRGRWVHFPLRPLNLARSLPSSFIAGVLGDSLVKVRRNRHEDSFEAVLQRGLGGTICRDFYFPYARKIWGLAPRDLDAEQARRRVAASSLGKMFRKLLRSVPGFGTGGGGRFFYPRGGFGRISEAYQRAAAGAGAAIRLETAATAIELQGGHVTAVRARAPEGELHLPARHVLSTIPIVGLPRLFAAPPQEVLEAACALRSRAMVLVYLVLATDRFTEYDAHYFPEPGIAITRLSEPKNYGLADKAGTTVLCAELPCSQEDAYWRASDNELARLVLESLKMADLAVAAEMREVSVRRLPHAYPIYTRDYRFHFDRIDSWLGGIGGLMSFGRQGLFAHDNTHHALAMAYAANECLDCQGALDHAKWAKFREEFQTHIVED